MLESGRDEILDATAYLVTEDGFDAVSILSIAMKAGVSEDQVLAHFGSLEDLLVAMLDREFERLRREILDDLDRDPRGGLLSHIYRYTISGVYESPLVRALYLADRDGLNTIMRSTYGFSHLPGFGVKTGFVERMKAVGMVRPEVDAEALAAVLTAVSAGAALTAPDSHLDLVSIGLFDLLSASVDAEVDDTTPGKATFAEYAMDLTRPDPRR